jgi:hypothetical protein
MEAKDKLIAELSGIKQVSLTTDCWTSINNEGFMTVTVHYLSAKIKMVSRVLNTIINRRKTINKFSEGIEKNCGGLEFNV